jgi:hypothetical protein
MRGGGVTASPILPPLQRRVVPFWPGRRGRKRKS